MSRQVLGRYILTATLEAIEPIHVGGAYEGLATDMLCAVDGSGSHYLPGPALAGALRAELRARGVESADLWGADTTDAASRVRVADARATGRPVVEIRDGVAIAARSGTAARGLLYTREVLPAGTEFAARVVIEELPGEPARDLACNLAALLAGGGFTVGAFTTKGLGRLRASLDGAAVTLVREDLASATGLLDALFGASTTVDFTGVRLAGRAEVTVRIPWRARGPILVSRALDGGLVDTIPLTTSDATGARLCLPGSSIKGALRAQAQRIVATMGSGQAAHTAVTDLFGTAGQRVEDPVTRKARNTGQRGALRVADVRSTAALSPGVTLGVPSSAAQAGQHGAGMVGQLDAVAASGGPRLAVGDHVAIDRWTGGARESALFSVLEPWQVDPGQWEPISLVLELNRIPGERRDAALGLLALVCRDLCEGWIGIGFGTARGYGAIEADDPQFGGIPGGADDPVSLSSLINPGSAGHPARAAAWVAALWEEQR